MNHDNHVLEQANELARVDDLTGMYRALRALPLADFCMLHLNSAPLQLPYLARALPQMPSPEVQKKWVGDSGASLMARSCSLTRLFDLISWRTTGTSLSGKRILDYGCGWGRLLRLMNYYSDPDLVSGVDVMQQSLDLCTNSRIPNRTELVPARPNIVELRVGADFDFAYLFSVFSHTPEDVTRNVLRYLASLTRDDAVVVATIRNFEWLKMREKVWPARLVTEMYTSYADRGYAFVPLNGDQDVLAAADYGDTIMTPSYFAGLAAKAGWRVVAVDRDVLEPFQIAIALKKA